MHYHDLWISFQRYPSPLAHNWFSWGWLWIMPTLSRAASGRWFVWCCLVSNLVFKHLRSSWPQDPHWAVEIIAHAVFDHHSQFGGGLWGSEVTAVVVAKWAQLTKLSSFSAGVNGHIRHHTKGQKDADGVHSNNSAATDEKVHVWVFAWCLKTR